MNTHLSEETLVLLHYGEPCEPDAASHLDSCASCQAEASRLAEVLGLVEILVPEPDSDFERRTWDRLGWRLRGEKRRNGRFDWKSIAATAALVVLALLAGLWINRPLPVSPGAEVAATAPGSQRGERVMLLVVSDHLDRTERVLLELSRMTSNDEASLDAEQRIAGDLVAANRLYRIVASERDPRLADLLEDIEPILVELAHAPRDMSAEDLKVLQKRIEDNGLIFKLRVSGARVRGQQKTGPSV